MSRLHRVDPRAARLRGRRDGGFTLVELMVVVVIIASVGALGASMMRRAINGSTEPSFARATMQVMHEARHSVMTTGRAARVRIVLPSGRPVQLVSEVLDPADTTKSNWLLVATTNAPPLMQFCQPAVGVSLVTGTPTCPITSTMNTIVCFAPNGRVNLTTSSVACPGTGSSTASLPATGGGATIYFRGTQSTNNDVKYKLLVWGLTGLPKLVDSW